MSIEQTLSIIKPDGVEKNLIGEIFSRFEKAGLQIIAARMLHLSKSQAKGFYALNALKVVVDKDSLALIDGTEVDFIKEGLNEAFRFRNPNVIGECGCGESFSV